MERTKRVCLVVDNPSRDLEGLVLVARLLAERGVEAFLVPMYEQGYEVPAICPDFVLMNYARKANRSLIKAYSDASISVGVMDTEGGIFQSEEQYIKSVDHEKSGQYIDLYCFWGDKQYDAFIKHTSFAPDKLKVTGCPRYDYYSSRWKMALNNPSDIIGDNKTPVILIISNYVIAYPRYALSRNREIKNMIESGHEREYAEKRLEDNKNLRKKTIETADMLSKDFPNMKIVIRTHPFEDGSEYISRYKNSSNVYVTRKGTVGPWINSSMIILHVNSSVALDAYMMRKPVFSFDWFTTSISRGMSQLPLKVSEKLRSYNDLVSTINRLNDGGSENDYIVEDDKIRNEVESYFHKCDGKNSERLVDNILTVLNKSNNTPDPLKCKKMALYGSRLPASIKGYFDGFGRILFGPKAYGYLRNHVLTKNLFAGTKSEKSFTVEQIKMILINLENAEPILKKISVAKIKRKDAIMPRIADSSLIVKSE